jgi:4-hydroxybenzoate polyprenyltransferase
VVAFFSTSASFLQATLIALSLCCVASYGFLINDCEDMFVDRINNSNRLENANKSELKCVWLTSFILLAVAFALSLTLGARSGIIIGLVSIGLTVYTFYARKKLIFATVLAAVLSSTPLWTPGLIFDSHLSFSKIGVICIAVFLLMGREILFDVADVQGDSHGMRRTFATVFSKEFALRIAISLNFFGAGLLCLMLILGIKDSSRFVAWTGAALFCWLIFLPLFNLRNDLESPNRLDAFTQRSRLAMLLLPIFWLIF